MNLDKANKVLEKVKLASDDLVPTGAVLAWSRADGTNLSWAELTETLEYLIGRSTPVVSVPEQEPVKTSSGKKKE